MNFWRNPENPGKGVSLKAALLFWFFGGFRCGVPLFMVMLFIY